MFYLLGVDHSDKAYIIAKNPMHKVIYDESKKHSIGSGPNDWKEIMVVSDKFTKDCDDSRASE
jgi:stress-induced morphogen